jgi:uncharacterized protein (DUF2267 family)
MSATGLEVFDTTLHKTHRWLNELMLDLGWQDRHRAYLALRATLHALRDRLTVEEVAQLGAQLPILPTGKPAKLRREQFLEAIGRYFGPEDGVDPEMVARGVFQVLASHVTSGEIEDVKHVLPSELRGLWPSTQAT